MKSILKVGITGGIGVGKTTVSKIFQLLGIAIYNADERAKLLVVQNLDLRKSIIELVGNQAYLPNGNYNTTYIKQQIFSQKDLLTKLNQLIHPAVAIDFARWAIQQSSVYVLKEAALLVESGSYKDLDQLIVVTASMATRIERIQQRDQRSEVEINNIINYQLNDDDKISKSNFIVSNDNKTLLIPQVIAIDGQLRQFARYK